jgi:hypothetical protein
MAFKDLFETATMKALIDLLQPFSLYLGFPHEIALKRTLSIFFQELDFGRCSPQVIDPGIFMLARRPPNTQPFK